MKVMKIHRREGVTGRAGLQRSLEGVASRLSGESDQERHTKETGFI